MNEKLYVENLKYETETETHNIFLRPFFQSINISMYASHLRSLKTSDHNLLAWNGQLIGLIYWQMSMGRGGGGHSSNHSYLDTFSQAYLAFHSSWLSLQEDCSHNDLKHYGCLHLKSSASHFKAI